ncbi:MAG: RNA methyltransferase [Alphaproteobacteria bacterium]|nr:RNA methyltransferase [Alphaproteobacteria bacterium]
MSRPPPHRPPRPDRRRKQSRPAEAERPRHRRETLRIAGLPAVEALFARAPGAIERLYVAPDTAQAASALLREANARGIAHKIVPEAALAKIAGTTLNGGILAETAERAPQQFDVGQARNWADRWQPLVILDGIGNPHNLGAIARTAAFFGLPRIAISDHPSQAAPSEAAYRVSEGGLVWLDVLRIHRMPDVLRRLQPFYLTVATALGTGRSIAPGDLAAASKPVCLVLGNEEDGLPAATLAACERVVTLPGSGRVQSLNVAATAAILINAIAGPRARNLS